MQAAFENSSSRPESTHEVVHGESCHRRGAFAADAAHADDAVAIAVIAAADAAAAVGGGARARVVLKAQGGAVAGCSGHALSRRLQEKRAPQCGAEAAAARPGAHRYERHEAGSIACTEAVMMAARRRQLKCLSDVSSINCAVQLYVEVLLCKTPNKGARRTPGASQHCGWRLHWRCPPQTRRCSQHMLLVTRKPVHRHRQDFQYSCSRTRHLHWRAGKPGIVCAETASIMHHNQM